METNLYTGKTDIQLNYFTEFLKDNSINFHKENNYLGNKLIIQSEYNFLKILSAHICRFIFDFYLREAVLIKIYDEYYGISTEDAGHILTKLSEAICNTPINEDVFSIISLKHSFNPESYCVFNLKSVMICIYALTDRFCIDFLTLKEKENLESMIKTLSSICFESKADAEFSTDD